MYGAAVKGFVGTIPPVRLNAVQADPRVLLVEAERAYELDVQQLPTGINRIEVDRNPSADIDQVDDEINLDVGMLDSGIDQDHPNLNVAGGINFAGRPASKWDDGNGHGTHTAGTVGAIDNGIGVVGVAPGVRLWAVRVCKNGGICMTGDIIARINWMAAQKAADIDFAVANMSISTSDDVEPCKPSSRAVHQAICGLVNSGVVFAMSAGNNNRKKDAFPEVLAVSALADFDGKGGGQGSPTCRSDQDETLANFSNFGPEVDIAAPGVCILSTWNDGGTNTISGTSMASPHMAGAVALYLHANGSTPATNGAGVDAIEAAIIGAALPEGITGTNPCSYHNERGSTEPLLFVNGAAFGGDGGCEVASPPAPVTDVAITAVNAPSPVVQGDDVDVDVTVENVGNQAVAAGITVTLVSDNATPGEAIDDIVIGSQIAGGLAAEASTLLTFLSWNTTDANTGDHTLTASHDFADDAAANNSESTTVTITVTEPTEGVAVDEMAPNTMEAGTNNFNVTITGSGLVDGAVVTFENGSGPTPTASVAFGDGNTLTATVTAKSGGPPRDRVWDVRVTNLDNSSDVLFNGFTVTP